MIRSKTSFIIGVFSVLFFFVAMLVPVEYIPLDTRDDKIHHGLFFFIITLVFFACLNIRYWKLIALTSGIAVVSELSQLLVPRRSSNWLDLQADFIGIALAAVVILLFLGIHKKIARDKKDYQP